MRVLLLVRGSLAACVRRREGRPEHVRGWQETCLHPPSSEASLREWVGAAEDTHSRTTDVPKVGRRVANSNAAPTNGGGDPRSACVAFPTSTLSLSWRGTSPTTPGT